MKKRRHTPGPWIAVGRWVEHPSDKRADICTCDPAALGQEHLKRSDAEICANAPLIAAAPEMYAALLNVRSFIATDRDFLVECCTGPAGEVAEYDASAIATYDELLAQIDVAISKAGGKT